MAIAFVLATLWLGQAASPTPAADKSSRPAEFSARASADSPGGWLVHLARHHGHIVDRADPRSITLHCLALMMAAARVQPEYAEPNLWQYDLYGRIGREDDAQAALKRYVELDPTDETAWLQYEAHELARRQTLEQRVAYVRQELAKPGLPRAVVSDLNVRLAEYHRQRGELDPAGRCLENALRAQPTNVHARQMAFQVFGETEPALQRVELALAMVAANPGQVNLLWELGDLLDSMGLHREAQEWFVRAIELHERATRTPAPPEYWYTLARSQHASTDDKAAAESIDKALKARPHDGAARVLKSQILARLNPDDADAPMSEVARQYETDAEQVLASRNIAKAADLAWFYAYHRADPQRAMKLATLATSVPGATTLGDRAMGFALLLNDKPQEALDRLRPIAGIDSFAALGAARALLALKRDSEAVELLRQAAAADPGGEAYEPIAKLLESRGEKPPTKPAHERVIEALQRFDRRVFDFHKRPGDFLKLTVALPLDPPPVGPWYASVRLENIGPFPVTVGEGLMAQPLVLFSARLGSDPAGLMPNYTQVILNRRPVLLPGEAIEVSTALDVGPIREHLIRNASGSMPVEITAVFDPVVTPTGYDKGLSTIEATPVRFSRTGLPRDLPGVKRMVLALKDAPLPDRLRAIDGLGALLAENERLGTAAPADDGVKVDAIRKRMVALLEDPNWYVRARTIEALRWSRQPQETESAVAKGVQDSDFVVQMMGIRFFAKQQGDKFNKVLESIAKNAPEHPARVLARSFLPPTGDSD